MMKDSTNVREVIGRYQRFRLSCPLWVVRLEGELSRDANAIKPYNWREEEDKPPYEMIFHVTEFCNASCSFCCYRYSKPRRHMSNEVFFKAAREYYDMGGKRIALNALTGEPLLDPHIFEKTAFLKSLGRFDSSGFTTNGILLSRDEVVESVLDSGLSYIAISTSGFDRATYERVMGVKKYDEFLLGLCKLLRRSEESDYPISIIIAVRGLIKEVETEDFSTKVFPYICSSSGKVHISFLRLYTDWIGQVKVEDLPANCGFQGSHLRIKPCNYSLNLGVLTNGDLRLCHCQFGERGREDVLTLGNIMNDSLVSVWCSDTTRRIRRTTYGRNANEICRRCKTYAPIYR